MLHTFARTLAMGHTCPVHPAPTAPVVLTELAQLRARIDGWSERPRVLLGLCGVPGAGKSTLASLLADELGTDRTRVVPMDGFHLSNARLAAQGLAGRKGSIDTFDGDGYAALLGRLRRRDDAVVYAPEFDRRVDDPVAASIAVERHIPLVLTEGNYLLSPGPAWQRARAQLDEVWFVDADDSLRRARLVERHVRFGKTRAEAERWVAEVDEANAAVVAAHAASAAVTVRLSLTRGSA